MSILSVDQISPIGSGTTVTLNATEIKTGNEITVGTGASIFSPAGNTLTFGTNNVERIRIKNDGAVGINTDVSGNGGGAKLVVGGRIQSNAGGYWFAGANGAEDGWHVQDSGGNFVVVESGVAERLRITSDGKFGFGTSSPDQTVHIHKGSAGSVSSTTNTVLTLENSTTNILQFLNPNNTVAQIRFGDPQDDGAGFIEYSHSTNTMSFGTNGPTRMQIDSSGNITIPDSIIHQGDTDTKIRFVEDNKISFETGGTERLRIDNVGVLYTGNYVTTLDATPGSIQMSGGTAGARLSLRGTTTSTYGGLGEIHGFWDTNKVASILFHAGGDTTNKDDGEIRMYTRTSGGGTSERFGISSLGNIRWRAGSVHQRKTGAFLGINNAGTSDIKISGNFENNDMLRVRWAYNWNAGDGGAWGEAVIWKQYEGTKRVRYLTDVKANPVTSVSFPHSGNDIWLRWQTNAGINGYYMIDVETHGCEPFPF